jgi:hypothetical protein
MYPRAASAVSATFAFCALVLIAAAQLLVQCRRNGFAIPALIRHEFLPAVLHFAAACSLVLSWASFAGFYQAFYKETAVTAGGTTTGSYSECCLCSALECVLLALVVFVCQHSTEQNSTERNARVSCRRRFCTGCRIDGARDNCRSACGIFPHRAARATFEHGACGEGGGLEIDRMTLAMCHKTAIYRPSVCPYSTVLGLPALHPAKN